MIDFKVDYKETQPESIESGYFVFTLMPSLRCKLNCPHCYLSLEERRNSPLMEIKDLKVACEKVDAYYQSRGIKNKVIVCYWYGGEPTDMGRPYFEEAVATINSVFAKEKGYYTKHTVLSSLIGVDHSWFDFFKEHCEGLVQSSFDGLMRGKNYLKKWEAQVKAAKEQGMRVSTISVVNRELINATPEVILDYLGDLGIEETSWLPFMWNQENDGDPYRKFAPSMDEWSEFMIRLTKHHRLRTAEGRYVPKIGQEWFILSQGERDGFANLPAQTLFLMPNGDFVLPDYKNGFQEFLRPFGNILTQSFAEVLQSPERKTYLRKQALRNKNSDCAECEFGGQCVMEFWKDNRPGDDCFGGKKYVTWLVNNTDKETKEKMSYSTLY